MKIGILGGGQLGRMLRFAGQPLGWTFEVLEEFNDPEILGEFSKGLDAVTYEWENVPFEAAKAIAAECPDFFPVPEVLEVIQDRFAQKSRLSELGIETAPFEPVNSLEELKKAVSRIKMPCVLKTRRMGYDGKGQFVIGEPADIAHAWEALGGEPAVLEGFVHFDAELSIVCVRGSQGVEGFYPLAENVHHDGILHTSIAPARPALKEQAESIARKVLDGIVPGKEYVGVMALEFFLAGDNLLVNEIAARVHNTGHWTIEGAVTSQFENHLRAGLGLPLGSTDVIGHSGMVNLIGELPDEAAVLGIPGAHLHIYGKEPRPGRKLGHITVNAPSHAKMMERFRRICQIIGTEY